MTHTTQHLHHKTKPSFQFNEAFVKSDQSKYGQTPCLISNHNFMANTEIFVQLDSCHEWYEKTWGTENYVVPNSLKTRMGRHRLQAEQRQRKTNALTNLPS